MSADSYKKAVRTGLKNPNVTVFEVDIKENNHIGTALAMARSKGESISVLEQAGFVISRDRGGYAGHRTIFEDQVGDRIVFSISECIVPTDNDGIDILSELLAETHYKCVASRIDGPVESEINHTIINGYKIKLDSDNKEWVVSSHGTVGGEYGYEDAAIEHAHRG
jgi:hypothetical protein